MNMYALVLMMLDEVPILLWMRYTMIMIPLRWLIWTLPRLHIYEPPLLLAAVGNPLKCNDYTTKSYTNTWACVKQRQCTAKPRYGMHTKHISTEKWFSASYQQILIMYISMYSKRVCGALRNWWIGIDQTVSSMLVQVALMVMLTKTADTEWRQLPISR
jgi:hypothetical protein